MNKFMCDDVVNFEYCGKKPVKFFRLTGANGMIYPKYLLFCRCPDHLPDKSYFSATTLETVSEQEYMLEILMEQ